MKLRVIAVISVLFLLGVFAKGSVGENWFARNSSCDTANGKDKAGPGKSFLAVEEKLTTANNITQSKTGEQAVAELKRETAVRVRATDEGETVGETSTNGEYTGFTVQAFDEMTEEEKINATESAIYQAKLWRRFELFHMSQMVDLEDAQRQAIDSLLLKDDWTEQEAVEIMGEEWFKYAQDILQHQLRDNDLNMFTLVNSYEATTEAEVAWLRQSFTGFHEVTRLGRNLHELPLDISQLPDVERNSAVSRLRDQFIAFDKFIDIAPPDGMKIKSEEMNAPIGVIGKIPFHFLSLGLNESQYIEVAKVIDEEFVDARKNCPEYQELSGHKRRKASVQCSALVETATEEVISRRLLGILSDEQSNKRLERINSNPFRRSDEFVLSYGG